MTVQKSEWPYDACMQKTGILNGTGKYWPFHIFYIGHFNVFVIADIGNPST
jgi:hypothetical protein